LTSIRFVLALGVVLFHYQVNMITPEAVPIALIERARLGVDIFFILSGFVLAHVYGPQIQEGRYSHRRFIVARFARIYPTHLAMLVLMGLVAIIAVMLRQPFAAAGHSLTDWFADLFLVQAWLPISPTEWNGPAWSLSAEWAAYLTFPLFAYVGLRRGRNPWLTVLLAALVFAVMDLIYRRISGEVVTHADSTFGVLRIPGQFLYGIGLPQLSRRLHPRPAMAVAAEIISASALLASMHWQLDERITVALAGPFVLSLAMVSRSGADGVLAHPAALLAGEASYALYLAHMPVLVIWKNAIAVLTGSDSSYRLSVVEVAVLLPITLAAAVALYTLWENPARAWIRGRLSSPSNSLGTS
jgi:hypothetical protein